MQTVPPGPDRPAPRETDADGAALSSTAIEWLVDAFDCNPQLLANLEHMKRTCTEVVRGLELRVIGQPQWHQFPAPQFPTAASPFEAVCESGGVTGLYLLAESHLSCHTFPEHRLAVFNLYCCRSRPAWDWALFLQRQLAAAEVVIRSVLRGSPAAVPSSVERKPR